MSSFCFLHQSNSLSSPTVFDSISSNIDEVLLINSSANVFVFGDFNVHHKDWITYSGLVELTDLVSSVVIFLCQMTLLRWLTFVLGSQAVILAVLLLWIYLFLLILVFVLQWLSLHSDHVVILVSIDFQSCLQQDALFHHIAFDYSHADWDSLCNHSRDVPWEDLLVNFVGGFRLELMYIPLIESIRSSLTHIYDNY